MARTMGRPEPLPWHKRLFAGDLRNFARELFVPMHEIKGGEVVAERGGRAIKKTEFYSRAEDVIRQLAGEKRNQQRLALSDMTNIVGGLKDAEDHHLFQTKVFTDEMSEAVDRGEMPALPGFSRDEAAALVKAEQARLEPIVKANPAVDAAYQRHLRLQRAVGHELVSRGLIDEDMRQNYITHVVLDYMKSVRESTQRGLRLPNLDATLAAKARGESGKPGLRDYTPGSLKPRKGMSVRDISRDYLAVQYQYLSTAYEAIRRYDLIRELGTNYDIRNNPKLGAEPYSHIDYTEGDSPPPGYTRYDLRHGFSQLRGSTMSERLVGRILDEHGPELAKLFGVNPQEFDATLIAERAKGQLKAQEVKADLHNSVVIPDELAGVLRRVASNVDAPDALARASSKFIRTFKSVVLQKTPLQYNLRNIIGDFQRATAQFGGDMLDSSLWRDAYRDVVNAYVHKQYSFDMQKMQELNVSASGMTAIEQAGVHNEPQFQHLMSMTSDRIGASKVTPKSVAQIALSLPQKFSQAREDLVRAVIYKMNERRIQQGQPLLTGIVDVKGLDIDPTELRPADQLSNEQLDLRRRAAAKVARQSLIDYGGDFTVAEDRLRNSIIPFYSWIKGNMMFWPKLASGVVRGNISGRGASVAAMSQGAAMVSAYLAGVAAWNHLMMNDADEALPEYKQRRGHVILPDPTDPTQPWITRDDQGRAHIMTAGLPDALDDFMSWTGTNGIIPEMRALLDGRMTLGEYSRRRGEDMLTAIPKNLGNSLGPTVQAPLAIAGIQTFPDPLNPRLIPSYDRAGATLNTLGLGGLGGESFISGMPDGTSPLDVPKQLGLGSSLASPEAGYVRDLRMERSKKQAELDDLKLNIRRTAAGTVRPELNERDRAARVAQLQRTYDAGIAGLQRIDTRLTALQRTNRTRNSF